MSSGVAATPHELGAQPIHSSDGDSIAAGPPVGALGGVCGTFDPACADPVQRTIDPGEDDDRRLAMITNDSVRSFLDGHRIAVIGASDRKDSFARTIDQALVDHGYEVLPVNPRLTELDGRPCYASITDVPGPVDGAIVMVGPEHAAQAVEDVADAGVLKVWLFKGVGAPGAASPEAIAACERHGLETVAGACPLMFLEPVGAVHRIHRSVRHVRRAVERAA